MLSIRGLTTHFHQIKIVTATSRAIDPNIKGMITSNIDALGLITAGSDGKAILFYLSTLNALIDLVYLRMCSLVGCRDVHRSDSGQFTRSG